MAARETLSLSLSLLTAFLMELVSRRVLFGQADESRLSLTQTGTSPLYLYTEPRHDDDRRVITFETEPVKPPNNGHAGPRKKEKEKKGSKFFGEGNDRTRNLLWLPWQENIAESISLY